MKGKERLHQGAVPITCSAAAVLNSPRSLCSALGSEKKDGGSFFQEAVRHWASELGSRVKQMVWLTAPQRNSYWTYKCHSILLSLTFSGTSVQGLAHYRQTTHINVHQKIKKRSLSWKQGTAAQKWGCRNWREKSSATESLKPESNPQELRSRTLRLLQFVRSVPTPKSFLSPSLPCPAPIFNSYLPTTSPSHGLKGRQNAISIPWIGGKKSFNLPCGGAGGKHIQKVELYLHFPLETLV